MHRRLYLWLIVMGIVLGFIPLSTRAATNSWTNIFAQGGVVSVAINPASPNIIYVGTSGNGLYRSTNGGESWEPLSLPQSAGYIWALAIHPVTPTTIYAGTAGGLARSINGGDSWTSLTDSSYYVNTVVLNPVTPSTLYMGTGSRGIYRSIDGGSSWSAINTGLPTRPGSGPPDILYESIRSLIIDTSSPTTLYAIINGTGQVYRTTDGGASWGQVLMASRYVSSLAIAQTTPKTIYTGTDDGIWQSIDGGTIWRGPAYALPIRSSRALAVDPATPSTIYAAPSGSTFTGVYRSLDNGESWNAFNDGLTDTTVATLVIDPQTPTTIYAGTASGMFRNALLAAPTISAQPFNQRIRPGKTVTLSVVPGGGTPPFIFQWYQGVSGDTSNPVPGATSRTYTTPTMTTDTSYWVRVSNSVGSVDSTTAYISIKGPFQVNLDGFNFVNDYAYRPGTDPNAPSSWAQFKRTFPDTPWNVPTGQAKFTARDYFLSSYYQQAATGGNCAGMTAVSLLRYLDRAETVERDQLNFINRSRTQVFDLPQTVAGDVHLGLSDVKDYIFLYQARQLSLEFGDWWGKQNHWRDTPVTTFQAIQSRTQANEPVAVSIRFTKLINGQNQLVSHRMAAYRTEQSGSIGYIYVYDPNWPNDSTRRITVDLNGTGSWIYQLWSGETWSGTGYLHYSPASLNFPAHLNLGLLGGVAVAASGSSETILNVVGDASVLITDSQGHQIGHSNGTITDTLPGAAILSSESFNPTNPDALPVEAFYLSGGDIYTATIQPLTATSVYTLTALGGGSVLTLAGTSASSGQNDTLTLRNSVLDTTFTPATDGAYCEALAREVSDVNSREYTACIAAGTNIPARFTLDPAANTFSVQNTGLQAFNATLTTDQVGELTGNGTTTGTVTPGTTLAAPPPSLKVYLPLTQR